MPGADVEALLEHVNVPSYCRMLDAARSANLAARSK
jgi:hypothetical protein